MRVDVNGEKCERIAAYLRSVSLPPDREEAFLSGSDIEPSFRGNVYLALVAVCHQTTPVSGPRLQGEIAGTSLRGWDYLSAAFFGAARSTPSLFEPNQLARCSTRNFLRLIGTDAITGPDRRAYLIRDIGNRMVSQGWERIDALFQEAKGFLRTEAQTGVLDLLSKFEAYQDPVAKKSLFFAALMRNSGLWEFNDLENLGPPVDYHEVRGHLRMGTVRLLDPVLRREIERGSEVDDRADLEVRQAVYRAMMTVADASGYSPSQIHYFFWNVFRSCCPRETTHCESCSENCQLPPRYREPFGSLGNACVLRDYCESRSKLVKLTEHVCQTEWY